MREAIIEMLKPFAEACRRLTEGIPLDAAGAIYVGVLAILAVWVMTLRGQSATNGSKTGAGRYFGDLRLWAVLILAAQAAIYVVLR